MRQHCLLPCNNFAHLFAPLAGVSVALLLLLLLVTAASDSLSGEQQGVVGREGREGSKGRGHCRTIDAERVQETLSLHVQVG